MVHGTINYYCHTLLKIHAQIRKPTRKNTTHAARKISRRGLKNTLNPCRTSKSSLNLRRGATNIFKKIPKAAPESAEKRRQKCPKQPPRSLQNPLDPMARKRKPVLSVLTKPLGAQTLRFPLFFSGAPSGIPRFGAYWA